MERRELEEAFVTNFVRAEKQSQWSGMLGKAKRRSKARNLMSHRLKHDLDSRHASDASHWQDVESELRQRGAGNLCWVIAEHPTIDEQEYGLTNIIEYAFNWPGYFGMVVMCNERLAYFQDEDDTRLLLERAAR